MSHRTVGAHLEQGCPKLGITSRAQLHGVLGEPWPEAVNRVVPTARLRSGAQRGKPSRNGTEVSANGSAMPTLATPAPIATVPSAATNRDTAVALQPCLL